MLSNPQIWKLKAAQRQAGLEDDEYRETLNRLCGVQTSKDPRLGDEHLDMLLSYFEAVYWRGVKLGRLQPPCKSSEPFQQPGYWAAKNTRSETSRDRYNFKGVEGKIASLEARLSALGCHPAYLSAIRSKVTRGSDTLKSRVHYASALRRTLSARLKSSAVA